jgi:hypothetical protein
LQPGISFNINEIILSAIIVSLMENSVDGCGIAEILIESMFRRDEYMRDMVLNMNQNAI